MNTLETSCPRCGRTLDVPTAAVLLCRSTSGTTAWLICDGCDELVTRSVPPAFVHHLVAGGCHVVRSGQEPHPEERRDGPALDADDALALHELLADDAALAEVLSGLRALDEPA